MELPLAHCLPDFIGSLKRILRSACYLAQGYLRNWRETGLLKVKTVKLLDDISPLIENLPMLDKIISCDSASAETNQMKLGIDFMLRDIFSMLAIVQTKVRALKILNSSQYKRLKNYMLNLRKACDSIDNFLISRSDSPNLTPRHKTRIGSVELFTPLRIFIDDDDSGKYVSCLELPQIYGFGETEEEALAMLDREILSLMDDVRNADNIAEEYKIAAELIEMAMRHE